MFPSNSIIGAISEALALEENPSTLTMASAATEIAATERLNLLEDLFDT
jgi:hypothetical protein